ncbi:hypothetical protein BaRGS_00006804, partial [Batillaria attramentaria]
MGLKQKAKTPQPQKGQRPQTKNTPKSAPPGKKPEAKKGSKDEVSMKAVKAKLFHQNGSATPGKGKGTPSPKPGDKRKLDTPRVQTPGNKKTPGKPSTPAMPMKKGKPTPVKTPQSAKPQTPAAKKTPASGGKAVAVASGKKGGEKKPATPSAVKDAAGDAKRQADRDKKTLFVKNLPPDVQVSDIKALSKDILNVRLRVTVHAKNRQKKRIGFAYLEFASEAAADKNYKLLKGSFLKEQELMVDYVGEKSTHTPLKKKETADPDPLRLYITGFGKATTQADLHKLFPKAVEIHFPIRKKDKTPLGFAFARFANEQQAKISHDKIQGKVVDGCNIIVLFAKQRTDKDKVKAKKNKEKKQIERSQLNIFPIESELGSVSETSEPPAKR